MTRVCRWLLAALAGLLLVGSGSAATYNAASKFSGREWYVPMQGTGLAGTAVVAGAATALSRANPWITGITVGTQVAQYLLETMNGAKVAVRTPNAPMTTPAGWSDPPPGQTLPVPPSTTAPSAQSYPASVSYGIYKKDCSTTTDSASTQGDVNAFWNWYQYTCNHLSSSVSCVMTDNSPGSPGTYTESCSAGGTNYTPFTRTATWICPQGGTVQPDGTCSAICPPGYSIASGGVCLLTNAQLVKFPPDGLPTYVPTADGTGLMPDPRDPDPPPADIQPSDVANPGSNYHPDPYSNPVSTTITPTTDGVKIENRIQTTNGTQTATVINNIKINGAGQVTNASSTTVPGPIDSASSSAQPLAPGGGGGGSTQINFPTDYARQGEAAAAADKLVPKLDTLHDDMGKLHDDLTKTGDAPGDPKAPGDLEFDNAFFKDTFTGLLAWNLPAHTSTCPTVVFDYSMFGHQTHLVMDAQCVIAEKVKPVLSVVMVVVWVVVALFIVMGA